MAVAEAVSTNSRYKTFTGTNVTLATALAEVMNALDVHTYSMTNTKFLYDYDGTSYIVIAICKTS